MLLENAGVILLRWAWAEDNETSLTMNVVPNLLLGVLLSPELKDTATKFGTRPIRTIVFRDTYLFLDFPEKTYGRDSQ